MELNSTDRTRNKLRATARLKLGQFEENKSMTTTTYSTLTSFRVERTRVGAALFPAPADFNSKARWARSKCLAAAVAALRARI